MTSRSIKITDCFPLVSNANEETIVAENESSDIDTIVHPIFDGKYFKIKSRIEKTKKCVCICLLCNGELSASTNITTNLYKHLKVSVILLQIKYMLYLYPIIAMSIYRDTTTTAH